MSRESIQKMMLKDLERSEGDQDVQLTWVPKGEDDGEDYACDYEDRGTSWQEKDLGFADETEIVFTVRRDLFHGAEPEQQDKIIFPADGSTLPGRGVAERPQKVYRVITLQRSDDAALIIECKERDGT